MGWFRVSRRDNLDRHYVLSVFGFGLFVHRIHHDEKPDIYHSHPWDGVSLILGSYTEEQRGKPKRIRRFFNVLRAPVHHRVELRAGPVWSIFVHGRRYNRWEVVRKDGSVIDVEPWKGIGGRTSYEPEPIQSVILTTEDEDD